MSCILYWIPVNKEKNYISDINLRNILEKKFGFESRLDRSHIPYLNALQDAGVDCVDELIEAIEKYDVIEIDIEC